MAAMVSVIIPTYNEEQALPTTLASLSQQSGEYEVIVVDGASQDRTCEIAREFHFRIIQATKGRASQMNAAAAQASGEWLLFLHADTILPAGALARLNRLEGDPEVQAGGFLHSFSGDDWRLRLVSVLDNFRCRCSRIIYGDQAMFIRRKLFARLGGFPDVPILEDVKFCEKLLRVTRPVVLQPPVLTDSRKFVKMGVWSALFQVLLIIISVQFRLPIGPRGFFREIR
jgi:rSAM/selenodomain-associated transferase 2